MILRVSGLCTCQNIYHGTISILSTNNWHCLWGLYTRSLIIYGFIQITRVVTFVNITSLDIFLLVMSFDKSTARLLFLLIPLLIACKILRY